MEVCCYNCPSASTFSPTSSVEKAVTFNFFSTVCSLSLGLIRSGEYPTKKFTLNVKPLVFSCIRTHSSSATPGYTINLYLLYSLPSTKSLSKKPFVSNTTVSPAALMVLKSMDLNSLWATAMMMAW